MVGIKSRQTFMLSSKIKLTILYNYIKYVP